MLGALAQVPFFMYDDYSADTSALSIGVCVMKQCQSCGKNFTPKPKAGHQKYCSVKCRTHNLNKSEHTKIWQQSRRQKLNDIKLATGCKRCGYNKHPAALQFNHVIGEKLFNISQDPKRKWEDIVSEIAKCEVLCANCHSIHSVENKHGWVKRKNKNDS
jgi:hypothetical protein